MLDAIALLYPHFFIDDSGAEFHADWESYKNLGLKINKNEVIYICAMQTWFTNGKSMLSIKKCNYALFSRLSKRRETKAK